MKLCYNCNGLKHVTCNHCGNGLTQCPACGGSGLLKDCTNYCDVKTRICDYFELVDDRPICMAIVCPYAGE